MRSAPVSGGGRPAEDKVATRAIALAPVIGPVSDIVPRLRGRHTLTLRDGGPNLVRWTPARDCSARASAISGISGVGEAFERWRQNRASFGGTAGRTIGLGERPRRLQAKAARAALGDGNVTALAKVFRDT
jgi:hypothetical protein